jgi:hypothetical protein
MAGSCKRGNERSGSIKCWIFFDLLRTGLLLKKDSNPWSKLVGNLSRIIPLYLKCVTA